MLTQPRTRPPAFGKSGPWLILLLLVVTTVLAISYSATTQEATTTQEAGTAQEAATGQPQPIPAAQPLLNTLPSGAPIQRLDTAGAPVDAHDGQVSQFDGRYYWYGTSYGCGFQWNNGDFCGFNVYQSDDLLTWEPGRLAFDPTVGDWDQACTLGCFRPHVARIDGQYVMWINVSRAETDAVDGMVPGAFRVLTAPTPAGPFTYQPGHGMTDVPWGGDANLLVTDAGAYLVATDISGKKATDSSHEIVIQKLTAGGLDAEGPITRLPGVGFVEAPTLWQHDGLSYLAIGDPACPYCQGSGVTVFQTSSSDLLTGWSEGYRISEDSCGGQLTEVSVIDIQGIPTTLLQSDRWVGLPDQSPTMNQALSSQAWVPLTYTSDRRVAALDCAATTSVATVTPAIPQIGTSGAGAKPLSLGPGEEIVVPVDSGGSADIRIWAARALSGSGKVSLALLVDDQVVSTTLATLDTLPWALSPLTLNSTDVAGVSSLRIRRDDTGDGLLILGTDAADPTAPAVVR